MFNTLASIVVTLNSSVLDPTERHEILHRLFNISRYKHPRVTMYRIVRSRVKVFLRPSTSRDSIENERLKIPKCLLFYLSIINVQEAS